MMNLMTPNNFVEDVNVLKPPYSAKGYGQTNDRSVTHRAMDKVHEAGGGKVLLRGGRNYLTKNLFLKSNVTLAIQQGATRGEEFRIIWNTSSSRGSGLAADAAIQVPLCSRAWVTLPR